MHDKQKVIDNLEGYTAEQIAALKKEMYKSYDDQLTRITDMVTV